MTRACMVHQASRPNQVWSWDITWLPTTVRGVHLYLYLVMDVGSRRIVGWRVADRESADVAAALVTQACSDGNIDPRGLVLHSDNGTPMRGSTMTSTLQWLGVVPSFSRPHVADDKPYPEALPNDEAHAGIPAFPVRRYRVSAAMGRTRRRLVQRRASPRAIRYLTPDERHHGLEHDVLEKRRELYERARSTNPERWTGATRNWAPVELVVLNPERAPREATA